MHEMSLMNGLMNRIYEVAAKEKAKKVTEVKIWLGALSHMSPSHFQEHFDEASKGGIAEGARIIATVSEDESHPQAASILLESIDVQDEAAIQDA